MTFELKPYHDLLLRGNAKQPIGVYQLQLATAEQLTRLHYSMGSLKTIKARLKTLTDHGYLTAKVIPNDEGRKPHYYQLASGGYAYLDELGFDIPSDIRAGAGGSGYLFVQHTLEINDIVIAAALLPTVHPDQYLKRFQHERELKRMPFKLKVHGHRYTLIPDAYLDIRFTLPNGRTAVTPVLLEHDRSTEGQAHFKQRVRAYIELLKARTLHETFKRENLNIAFSTFAGEARMQQMKHWTRAELESTNESKDIGVRFLFGALSQPLSPSAVWFTEEWQTPYTPDKPEQVA